MNLRHESHNGLLAALQSVALLLHEWLGEEHAESTLPRPAAAGKAQAKK